MFYIVIQTLPMFLLVVMCGLARSNLMCALDIIYVDFPISIVMIVFTCIFWLYQLMKYVIILVFCIDQHMAKKRKEYGFRRHRQFGRRRVTNVRSGSISTLHPEAADVYYDAEKAMLEDQQRFSDSNKGSSVVYAQSLVRDLLELGTTDESAVDVKKDEVSGARRHKTSDAAKELPRSKLKENAAVTQLNANEQEKQTTGLAPALRSGPDKRESHGARVRISTTIDQKVTGQGKGSNPGDDIRPRKSVIFNK